MQAETHRPCPNDVVARSTWSTSPVALAVYRLPDSPPLQPHLADQLRKVLRPSRLDCTVVRCGVGQRPPRQLQVAARSRRRLERRVWLVVLLQRPRHLWLPRVSRARAVGACSSRCWICPTVVVLCDSDCPPCVVSRPFSAPRLSCSRAVRSVLPSSSRGSRRRSIAADHARVAASRACSPGHGPWPRPWPRARSPARLTRKAQLPLRP